MGGQSADSRVDVGIFGHFDLISDDKSRCINVETICGSWVDADIAGRPFDVPPLRAGSRYGSSKCKKMDLTFKVQAGMSTP